MSNMYNINSSDRVYTACVVLQTCGCPFHFSHKKMGLTIQIAMWTFCGLNKRSPIVPSKKQASSPRLGSQRLLWPCNTRISRRRLGKLSSRVSKGYLQLNPCCLTGVSTSCNTSTPLHNNSDSTESRVLLNKSFARWKDIAWVWLMTLQILLHHEHLTSIQPRPLT